MPSLQCRSSGGSHILNLGGVGVQYVNFCQFFFSLSSALSCLFLPREDQRGRGKVWLLHMFVEGGGLTQGPLRKEP